MILSRSSLWQVNPLIEIMWGIFLLNTEDLLGERRLQTISYVVFIASWHKKCSYVLRQSCGPPKGAESCCPTENFILQLWETAIFFALSLLKRELGAWDLVFLENGIVWFPSRSPVTVKAGREASLIDNIKKKNGYCVWDASVRCRFGLTKKVVVHGGFLHNVLLSKVLVSQLWNCCYHNYCIVKPNLIRSDRFMAATCVVRWWSRALMFQIDSLRLSHCPSPLLLGDKIILCTFICKSFSALQGYQGFKNRETEARGPSDSLKVR